jgi:hypothetical protein
LQENDMRKTRLRIGDLRVESFATAGEGKAARGTVVGREDTVLCLTPECPPSVEPCVTHDLACLTRNC